MTVLNTNSILNFGFTPGWLGSDNMAIDSYLCSSSLPINPIFRLYTWDKYTISLGFNQNTIKRINIKKCEDDGVPVVRRPTGGRELLHGHDLCYSMIWPLENGTNSIKSKEYFQWVNCILIDVLADFGVNASANSLGNRSGISKGPCFAQIDSGEISVEGKKLIASAQRIFNNVILQQGSMPLCRPRVDIFDYLTYSDSLPIFKEKLASLSSFFYDNVAESVKVDEIVGTTWKILESKLNGRLSKVKFNKIDYEYKVIEN